MSAIVESTTGIPADPKKEYTFICLGLNVWGQGDTAEAAHVKAQKEFGRKLTTYITRRYLKASRPRVDLVDGSIWYDNVEGCESVLVAKVKKGKSVI